MHKGTAVHLWVKGFPYQLCHSAKPKSIWFPWFLSTTEATPRAGSTLCHHVAQQSTAATLEPALAGGQSSGVLVPTLQQSNPLGLILANVTAGNRSLLLAYPAPGYTEKQKGTHALRPTGEMSQCDGSLTLPWSSSWKKRRRSWRKDLHGESAPWGQGTLLPELNGLEALQGKELTHPQKPSQKSSKSCPWVKKKVILVANALRGWTPSQSQRLILIKAFSPSQQIFTFLSGLRCIWRTSGMEAQATTCKQALSFGSKQPNHEAVLSIQNIMWWTNLYKAQ